MRDKLIELIVHADIHDVYECMLCTKEDDACDCCYAEKLADYLLANDVTVPPCKIGDDIWVPKVTRDEVYKTKAVGFIHDVVTSPYNAISFDEIHTSKKEAEKALKEKFGNDNN